MGTIFPCILKKGKFIRLKSKKITNKINNSGTKTTFYTGLSEFRRQGVNEEKRPVFMINFFYGMTIYIKYILYA